MSSKNVPGPPAQQARGKHSDSREAQNEPSEGLPQTGLHRLRYSPAASRLRVRDAEVGFGRDSTFPTGPLVLPRNVPNGRTRHGAHEIPELERRNINIYEKVQPARRWCRRQLIQSGGREFYAPSQLLGHSAIGHMNEIVWHIASGR